MPPFRVDDVKIIQGMKADGLLGPRVVVVEATAHSKVEDVRRCADSVARGVRRLEREGYNLRHVCCKAIVLRSDNFNEGG